MTPEEFSYLKENFTEWKEDVEVLPIDQIYEKGSLFGNYHIAINSEQLEELKKGKVLYCLDEYGVFIVLDETIENLEFEEVVNVKKENRIESFLRELNKLTERYDIFIGGDTVSLYGVTEQKQGRWSCYTDEIFYNFDTNRYEFENYADLEKEGLENETKD